MSGLGSQIGLNGGSADKIAGTFQYLDTWSELTAV